MAAIVRTPVVAGGEEYSGDVNLALPSGAVVGDRLVAIIVKDAQPDLTLDVGDVGWREVAHYTAPNAVAPNEMDVWVFDQIVTASTPATFRFLLSNGTSTDGHLYALGGVPAGAVITTAFANGNPAGATATLTAPTVVAAGYSGEDPFVIRLYAVLDPAAYDGAAWTGPTGTGVTIRSTVAAEGSGDVGGTDGNPLGYLSSRTATRQMTGKVAAGTLSADVAGVEVGGGDPQDPGGWVAGTIVVPTVTGTQVETATGTADAVQLDATGAASKAATVSAPPAGLALDTRGVHQRGAQAAGERTVRLGAAPVATERVAASSATSAVGLSAHGVVERAATAPGDVALRLGTLGASTGRVATATGRAALALPTDGTSTRQAATAGSARVELGTSSTHQRVASSSGRVSAGMGSSVGAGARLAGSAGSAPLALSARGFSSGYLILEATGRVGLGLSARGAGAKAAVVVGQADVQLRQHGQADRLGVSSARVGLGLVGSGPADRTGYAAGQSAHLLDAHGAAHSVATARGTRVTRLAADGAVDRIGYSDGRAPLGLVARGAGAGEGGTGTATGRVGLGLLAVGAGRKDAGTDGLVGLVLGTHRAVLARPGVIRVKARPTGITIEGGPR